MNIKTRIKVILALLLVASGCSDHVPGPPPHGEVGVAVAPVSIVGNYLTNAGPTASVSGGSNLLGITVPTGKAVAGRIENGLEGNARRTQGNFRTVLRQSEANLPKVTNLNDAAGFDQIQLLVYAACSDLTMGSPSRMQSVYGIQPGNSVVANQAALVLAGVRMLDKHTAGLASRGPDSVAISTILTNLVQSETGISGITSTMVFMTVCIAANSAGTTLLGM